MQEPRRASGVVRLIGRTKLWWLLVGVVVGLWVGWSISLVR